MNRKRTPLIVAALLVLSAGIAWTVFTVPEEPAEAPEEASIMEHQSSFLSEEKNGRVLWDLRMESSEGDMVTGTTTCKNPVGHYYAEDGTVLTLTAPEGIYHGDTKDVQLFGGVEATTTDGRKLTSDALEWRVSEERLIATGNAVFLQPGVEARGDKIEARAAFTIFRAEGNAYVKKEN